MGFTSPPTSRFPRKIFQGSGNFSVIRDVCPTQHIPHLDKCNFCLKNIQISKPDGGGIDPAKSLTGRQKNDTRGVYMRIMQCRAGWRSERVKRCSAPSTEHRKNAGYSFDPQLWPTPAACRDGWWPKCIHLRMLLQKNPLKHFTEP